MRHFSDRVGGAGSDDQQIRTLAKANMQNMSLTSPEVCIGKGFAPSDGLKCERGNELLCRWGEDHIHMRTSLGQF